MPEKRWSIFKSFDAFGVRKITNGDLIRPWIVAGPYFQDLSAKIPKLCFFENAESNTGVKLFRQHLEEAETLMSSPPVEGQELTFLGQTLPYELLRTEEPLMTWGQYFFANTMVGIFFSTRIIPEKAGGARFRVLLRKKCQLAVAVNGKIQFRTYENGFALPKQHTWHAEEALDFDLELAENENILTLGVFKMGRIASGGLYLETVDSPLRIFAPLAQHSAKPDRKAIEATLDLFYPVCEWFYPENPIRIKRFEGETIDAEIQCDLLRNGEVLKTKTLPASSREVDMGIGCDIGSGAFEIRINIVFNGEAFGERRFKCIALIPTTPLPGRENFEERCRRTLKYFATGEHVWSWPAGGNDMWVQVVRYVLGQPESIDANVISAACEIMDARQDCADFVAHPMLWLLHMDREAGVLPDIIKNRIQEAFYNFKYWLDEPGSDNLCMGTENHRILFHAAEFLAGVFWPEMIFPNAGMSGREHMQKGRRLVLEWLRERGSFGFEEWHSSSYYPHWIVAVLSLYEYSPEDEKEIRALSHDVLTMGCFNLASDSFEGIFGTSHGRIYVPGLKVPDMDGCAPINWLLYGRGHLGNHADGVVPMAVSQYRPPAFFEKIAQGTESCSFTRHRQGRTTDARFVVQRTPDYMMSVLQDYNPGCRVAQAHVFQLTFQDRVVIFFSCPETSQEGGGHRPDYWSGNAFLPRAFGTGNAAVLLFRPEDLGWISHCYFERDRFDEVEEKDGWIFARKNNGFVGIWSEHGIEFATTGSYAGRELLCREGENAWVVEAGRKNDWGDFAHFVDVLCATHPCRKNEKIVFQSPSAGKIQMGWEGAIFLDGIEVDMDYPLLDSPYGDSGYGSGKMVLHNDKEQIDLDFTLGKET